MVLGRHGVVGRVHRLCRPGRERFGGTDTVGARLIHKFSGHCTFGCLPHPDKSTYTDAANEHNYHSSSGEGSEWRFGNNIITEQAVSKPIMLTECSLGSPDLSRVPAEQVTEPDAGLKFN